jgi:SSS family solute:Na+ symporter
VLQSLGIILFAVASFKIIGNPAYVADAMYELLEPMKLNFWNVEFSQFTVWLLTFGIFYLVDPWIYMWAYIGQTPKVSSNGMLAVLGGSYYNVLPFLSGLCILLGSITGKLVVPEGLSGDALYAWFSIEFMSPILGVVVLVGLLMTIISCGSSFAMNGVTILTRDIYQKVINKNAGDKQVLFASRVSLIVVTAMGIAGALWLPILVPLWSLAQAIGISGLLATTLCAWFWKRSTTAGAMTSTVLGGIVAFGWAVYAWIKFGNPGALVPMFGTELHAAHVGLAVAIPMMIIVSLCTKPEYEKAEATSYKNLGEELRTSPLVVDKQERPGVFGWLGANSLGWKAFWIVVFTVFALHYVLAFLFHIKTFGTAMIWISFVVGALMIFMLAGLGGRDLVNMARVAKDVEKQN